MKNRKQYSAPVVRDGVAFLASGHILASSVVNGKEKVRTTGQKVKEYNFEDTSFNQVWE